MLPISWAGLRSKVLGKGQAAGEVLLAAPGGAFEDGDRVQVSATATGGRGELFGRVVGAAKKGQCYSVEIYAPASGEEDALNPLLIPWPLHGLAATDLRRCLAALRDAASLETNAETAVANAAALLGAVGRPGASMCSVAVAELHRLGLGANATRRSARLGRLDGRPDLEGLTCTVLSGPNDKGQYMAEMSLAEGEDAAIVIVRPVCLTLRLRRSDLPELLVTPKARRQARFGSEDGEICEPAADLAISSSLETKGAMSDEHESNVVMVQNQTSRAGLPAKAGSAFPYPSQSQVAGQRRLGRQNDDDGGPSLVARAAALATAAQKELAVAESPPPSARSIATVDLILEDGRVSSASPAAAEALAAAASQEQILRDRKFEALDAALADDASEEDSAESCVGEGTARGLPGLPSRSAPRLPTSKSTESCGSAEEARVALAAAARRRQRKEAKRQQLRGA